MIYVDREHGVDSLKAGESQGMPFRTITFALKQFPKAVIHLSSGQLWKMEKRIPRS